MMVKRNWLYLVTIILLAFGLRIARLDFQPLWMDEGYSVFFATRDFASMLTRTALDIHPPLYYALLHAWLAFTGISPFTLRLFSVFVGLATVPVVYPLAVEISRWILPHRPFAKQVASSVGIFAALILSISPFQIYYSQEVRMYGLLTLLAVASIWLQLRIMRSSESGRTNPILWLAYVLVTTAALYTHYYASFVLLAEVAVVALWQTRTNPRLRLSTWIKAWGAIFLLFLPWATFAALKLYTYVSAKVNIENYTRLDPFTFLAQHIIAFSVGHLLAFPWLAVASLLFALLGVFGIVTLSRRSENRPSPIAALVLLYLAVPLLLGYAISLIFPFHPIRYERLLLFAAPVFTLLVGFGVGAVWSRNKQAGVAAILAIGLFSLASLYDFYSVPRYSNEDYRPIFQQMADIAQPGDAALAIYPWQLGYMETYYHGARVIQVEVPSSEWVANGRRMESDLSSLLAVNSRVWLLAYQSEGHILEDMIANYLTAEYTVHDEWFNNTRLEYYARAVDPPVKEQPVIYSPQVELVSFGASQEAVPAGSGFIYVRLHWQARSDAYSYSMRLVAENGEKQVQQDGTIQNGDLVNRLGLFVPHTVPQGNHRLLLLVYPRAGGPPLASADGRNELILANVLVTAPQQ